MLMKRLFLIFLTLMGLSGQLLADVKLQQQGTATQLVVNGQPMLILGGELSNSAATSIADIDSVLPRMARLGLNTVFVPACWDLMEPEEGKFDFSLIDETIKVARENRLKIVLLWFGAWKNSMSCYAPLWFKCDSKRFPRATTANGKPLEIASAFSEDVFQADNKAFGRLMQHIADIDRKENTVVMMQIENEIGMLEAARDHSPLAEKAWRQPVPQELLTALKINKKGTWPEVFGTDLYAEEKFQAYHYARYVERLARTARSIHDIPLYVNAAMNSRGRKPGEYPSAGPLAHLITIWKCAAPSIDIYAPDIYDKGYKNWVAQYKRPDNPFFTPEVRLDRNSGVRALYTFGEADAIAYSPFAIDQAPEEVSGEITRTYDLLRRLTPTLLSHQGGKRAAPDNWGLLFDRQDKERVIEDGEVTLTCRHYFTLPWDARATDGSEWPEGGGLIVKLAKNEYLIAGNGLVVVFQSKTEKLQETKVVRGEDGFVDNGNSRNGVPIQQKPFTGKRVGIGHVDQVTFAEAGHMKFLRRDNGDQDHQGRHARISCGEYKMLHVKLYEY